MAKLTIPPYTLQQSEIEELANIEYLLEEQRKELRQMKNAKEEVSSHEVVLTDEEAELVTGVPQSEPTQELVESSSVTLTIEDIALLLEASNGKPTRRHIVHELPKDCSLVDRVQYTVDDTLAEVGRGLHRVADGSRDIVGGIIDVLTLGRAHRK